MERCDFVGLKCLSAWQQAKEPRTAPKIVRKIVKAIFIR